ncbi:hypothetical protein [Carboxylicivirga sp. M1479]|uniref:hypothetical protein n=1 Tax=Carboxylicivirga sp. M1479 TaxID=2594476 RepID=UPI00163D4755|nr:hypothetical protein [Carboxylicivirga sp. M1479]
MPRQLPIINHDALLCSSIKINHSSKKIAPQAHATGAADICHFIDGVIASSFMISIAG